MAELITLARPYAKAAFAAATATDALDHWSHQLAVAAAVAGQPAVRSLLVNPALSARQLANTFIGLCEEELDNQGQNFIRLLAENKRLPLLPQVSRLFENLKAAREQSVDVQITSAFAISPATSRRLVEALKSRLQRDVKLSTGVDAGLIGGAVIRAGDTVIDSSVRGKLNRLTESLRA